MLSYIKLLRPVNLFIIALTQYLILYFIIRPFMAMNGLELQMNHLDFALFVAANLFLAAAGYAINDYFDTDTDAINKPGKNMLLGKIPRGQAYTMNIVLNSIACVIGFYCSFKVGSVKLGFLFVIIALLLYYYSLKYKRQYITGNLVVALLAAYAVLSVWLFQFYAIKNNSDIFSNMIGYFGIITIFVGSFALFAFLISIIREIIKDMEDYEGDKACGCDTLAVKKGINFAKITSAVFCGITMILLLVAQILLFEHYPMLTWYLLVIQGLFLYLLIRLLKSKEKAEFHNLSIVAKIIMIAGILATQLLFIYY